MYIVCMYVCMYVCMHTCICMYVWMDGQMDGWMDGWMDIHVHVCILGEGGGVSYIASIIIFHGMHK